MKNKRGQLTTGGVLVIIALVIITLIIILTFFDPAGSTFSGLPGVVQSVVEGVQLIAEPLVNAVYLAVAPAGEDDNVKAIAFGIFLLIALIGFRTLNPFFNNKWLSFLIAAIVGVIASRSMTSAVVDESALAAAPLAGLSLFFTFFVVLGISRTIEKQNFTQYMKIGIMVIVAVVVFFFYAFVFDAIALGIIYGLGTAWIGVAQTFLIYFKKNQEERQNMSLGRYMAGVHEDIETAKQMQQGAQ